MTHQIDILMATYQGAHYVREQIESIQKQTNQDWRLIVNDDGSTDGTWEILTDLSKIDPRIVLLPRTVRFGVIGNFSSLMQYTFAPYIMFSDQDDVWFPNKIAETLAEMKAMEQKYGNKTPLLVHTDLRVVDAQLKPINPSFWQYAHLDCRRFIKLNRLLTQNVVTGCTMMLNRSLLELARPVPLEALMHDWWIALVASTFGHISIVPEATMAYRQHGRNQLGAQAYGLKRIWHNGLSILWNNKKHQKAKQATLFSQRYNDKLDPLSRKVLEAYQDYCMGGFLKKRITLIKYGFYKSGFLRNAYEFLT